MKLGLALSGGGFRATLYHLGVITYLRNAGLLKKVSHVCSVSGGSVMGAHLVQNWSRYTDEDPRVFGDAAKEIVQLVQMDVRGRVVRRALPITPFLLALRGFTRSRRALRITATTELQRHYERFFKKCLNGELVASPELHILTTNLTNGGSCSFTRRGFVIDSQPESPRPLPYLMEATHIPLSRAVAASSAFPALFPPIELVDRQDGNHDLHPQLQQITDGGVYDNVGARKFRQILSGEPLDAVFLSDAGLPFRRELDLKLTNVVVGTARRASDILQERVAELEREAAQHLDKFIFLNITSVVPAPPAPGPANEGWEGPALDLEVQRYLPYVRTDLDRFSDVLVNQLCRHGCAVARHVLPAELQRRSLDVPVGVRPSQPVKVASFVPAIDKTPVRIAKDVQRASFRSSRIFSFRDWLSYVHLILALAALTWLSLLALQNSGRAHRLWRDLLAEYKVRHGGLGTHDVDAISKSALVPIPQEDAFAAPNYDGFDIERDARMYDLRPTKPPPPGKGRSPQGHDNPTYAERRVVLSRNGGESDGHFRVPYQTRGSSIDLRCRVEQDGSPVDTPVKFFHSKVDVPSPDGTRTYRNYELDVDMQGFGVGEKVEVITEAVVWNGFRLNADKEDPLFMKVATKVDRIELFVVLPTDKTVGGDCERLSGPETSNLQTASDGVFSISKDSNALFWEVDRPARAYYYRIAWTYADRGK